MTTPQWKNIFESFARRIQAGELCVGVRIPAEEDIARDWDVSRQTARRAIMQLEQDGLVTRKRRWGTVVSGQCPQKTGRVALLVDLFAQNYGFPQPDLIRGIQDGLGEDVHVLVAESKHDAEREARMLRKLRDETDGILLWPVNDARNTPLIQRIIDSGFPLVLLDRVPEGLRTDAVTSDHEASTFNAMQALEALGHRHIGFFSFHRPELSSVLERHRAYVRSLELVGITDSSRFERWFFRDAEEEPEQFMQTVADAVFALTHGTERMTALFCVQDSLAVAAYRACDRLGIRVPEDLELATFNDWPAMLLRSPWNMHRIVQRMYDIGKTAGEMLSQRIEQPGSEGHLRRIPTELILADTGIRRASEDKFSPVSPTEFRSNGGSNLS